MSTQSAIRLFVTGGTIDKHYNELNGELIFTETKIGEMLAQSRCKADIQLETLMLKDSLEMDEADRQVILKACQSCDESLVIITHGTDTMTSTAKHLAPDLNGKTVVLLGAMIPYAFKKSDALFNLGAAVAAVQCLSNNVYIAMNGKIFAWDQVEKNKAVGVFEEVK